MATKFRQTKNYLFRLQILKPLVVDVAYPLVPQVDIRLGFLSLREQSGVVCLFAHDMKHNKLTLAYNFTWEEIKVRKSFKT
jgi:hypothetical protein